MQRAAALTLASILAFTTVPALAGGPSGRRGAADFKSERREFSRGCAQDRREFRRKCPDARRDFRDDHREERGELVGR